MKILMLLFLLFISQFGFSQCDVLIWSDEFDGTGLPNSTFWGYDIGAGGWGNQEIQSYTNSTANVRQENGSLVIEAKKSGSSWTSARVKTQSKISFKYGKIIFRAKLPSGSGTWPALWMLGENITSVGWPTCGEIDVMEHAGKNQNVVQAALHTPSSNGNTVNKGSKTISTASTEFHEYSVSWNATRIAFYIDGILFYTYNPSPKNAANWPFDANQFLIMNIAMGGTFGSDPAFETGGLKNGIDPALTSAKMEIDYVRVYEERSEPNIEGSLFLFENQQGVQYSAPDYGGDVTYTWSVPNDASIVSGQGTKDIIVNWGPTDGSISLALTGDTGCSTNSTTINVATIVEPTGLKYTIDDFSNPALPGWSKNDNGITLLQANNQLQVTYNVSALKYIQYEMPKAVHLSDYGIIKLPISVPASSAIPNLLMTFRDGNGNETVSTNFEIKIEKNDDAFYTYSYNFNGLWSLNNPKVDDNLIKSLRIYMLSGQSSFKVGAIEVFNSKIIPEPPINLTASINEQGEIALNWNDATNSTSFHLYRSDSPSGTYVRIKSNIKTSEVPYTISPTEAINYYKITGVNSVGESGLSTEVEVIADITSVKKNINSLVSVYPNPSNGKFFITTNGEAIHSVKFFDARGIEKAFDVVYDNNLLTVELREIKNGNYFIIINQDRKTIVAKVIIQQ